MSQHEQPQRELGFWMCTALVVGNTIGMGIFMMPASLAPYGMNAMNGWLITVLGCLFLAKVFAGLAKHLAQEDGPYGYTRRALGSGVAFTVLWCYWVSVCVTNATLAVAVISYLSVFIPALNATAWVPAVAALVLLWSFVLVNLRGIRSAGWVQLVTTVLKLLPMLAVMLLGGWLFVSEPSAYVAHVPSTPLTIGDTVTASTIALFAMLGMESATIPAGKVRDSARTIPRATMWGTVLTAVIYIAVSVVPMLLIPQAELAQSNAPFADLFSQRIGHGFGEVLALFVVISGLGALNGWTLLAGELTQSFARHGGFPMGLGVTNGRGVPVRAFLLTGALATIMILMNYNKSMAQGFTFFSTVVTAANLPLYLFCSLSVLLLWWRGEIGKLGKTEWGLLFAAVFAVGYSIWAFVGVGQESFLWALALAFIGMPQYWWRKWRQRQAAQTATEPVLP